MDTKGYFWKFYQIIKVITNPEIVSSKANLVAQYANIGLAVLVICINVSLMLDPEAVHQWARHLNTTTHALRLILFCFSSLSVFTIYLIYFYFILVHPAETLVLAEDLILRNTEDVMLSNRDCIEDMFKDKSQTLGKCWRLALGLASPSTKNAVSFRYKLRSLPLYNKRIRGQVFLFEFGIEVYYMLFSALICFGLAGFLVVVTIHLISNAFPVGAAVIILLKCCLLSYLVFKLYQTEIVLISIISICQFGFYQSFKLINHRLANLRNSRTIRTRRQLEWFLQAHGFMVRYILNANKMYKYPFSVFLVTNWPSNVIMLVFHSTLSQSNIYYILLLVQVGGTLITIIPSAMVCTQVHASAEYFNPIQLSLASGRFKYRWMARYELVAAKRKLGYSAFPFETLTLRTVFDFAFRYAAIFIVFLSKLKMFETI